MENLRQVGGALLVNGLGYKTEIGGTGKGYSRRDGNNQQQRQQSFFRDAILLSDCPVRLAPSDNAINWCL